MRVTVVLRDDLLRRVEASAALEGMSLREFVKQALVHQLDRRAGSRAPGRRVKLPLVRSKHPGSLRITGTSLSEVLAGEDADARSCFPRPRTG